MNSHTWTDENGVRWVAVRELAHDDIAIRARDLEILRLAQREQDLLAEAADAAGRSASSPLELRVNALAQLLHEVVARVDDLRETIGGEGAIKP